MVVVRQQKWRYCEVGMVTGWTCERQGKQNEQREAGAKEETNQKEYLFSMFRTGLSHRLSRETC